MTIRQIRFAQAYALGYTATEAAVIAGYSADSAPTNAYRLLKDDNVLRKIQEIALTREDDTNHKSGVVMNSIYKMLEDPQITLQQRLGVQSQVIQLAKLLARPKPALSDAAVALAAGAEEDPSQHEPTIHEINDWNAIYAKAAKE